MVFPAVTTEQADSYVLTAGSVVTMVFVSLNIVFHRVVRTWP